MSEDTLSDSFFFFFFFWSRLSLKQLKWHLTSPMAKASRCLSVCEKLLKYTSRLNFAIKLITDGRSNTLIMRLRNLTSLELWLLAEFPVKTRIRLQDARADLSLRWAYMQFCRCCSPAHLRTIIKFQCFRNIKSIIFIYFFVCVTQAVNVYTVNPRYNDSIFCQRHCH